MKTYSIHEAKNHISKLPRKVSRGEEAVFGEYKKPQYKIIKNNKPNHP